MTKLTSPELELALEKAKNLHQSGKLLSALEIYQELLTTEHNNPNLHQLAAMAFYQNKQFQQAIHHYQKAIELSPNTSLLYVHLGNVYKNTRLSLLFNEETLLMYNKHCARGLGF